MPVIHHYVQQFIDWIIHHGGLYMIFFILFAETGLFLGFFLPGDSLLFAAGIYLGDLSKAFFNAPVYLILALLAFATATGSYLGYVIGKGTGKYLLTKKDSFLFKKKHLIQAQAFYEKHGKTTVFLSKFLPVIRTFAPLVAGMVKMPLRIFSLFNIFGSACWVVIITLSGHFLQGFVEKKYQFSLKDHVEYVTLVIILITTLPILFKVLAGRQRRSVIASKALRGQTP